MAETYFSRRNARWLSAEAKLKAVVDAALTDPLCDCVTSCLIYKRTGGPIDWKEGRDVWMHEAMACERCARTKQQLRGGIITITRWITMLGCVGSARKASTASTAS